jgi:hypothetical protein
MIEKKKDQCAFYLDYAAADFNLLTIGAVEGIVK